MEVGRGAVVSTACLTTPRKNVPVLKTFFSEIFRRPSHLKFGLDNEASQLEGGPSGRVSPSLI